MGGAWEWMEGTVSGEKWCFTPPTTDARENNWAQRNERKRNNFVFNKLWSVAKIWFPILIFCEGDENGKVVWWFRFGLDLS